MVSLALRRATSWCSCKVPFFALLVIVALGEGLFGRARAESNCPFNTPYLRAYPDPVTFDIEYTFDPAILNVTYTRNGRGGGRRWRVDGLTTGQSRVQCDWTVEAGDSDHTVSVTVVLTPWLMTSDQSPGDCWTAYDGDVIYGRELGKACDGQGATEKTFRGTGHSVFVVFNQGARTGLRSLRFRYRSEPTEEPKKTSVAQLAAVSSVVIAALGIGFLVLRFTHCCRPCRKRWCPQCTTQMNKDEEEEMGGNPSSPRELAHLTPTAPSAQGDTGLNSRTALPQHGSGTPSAPTDLGPDGYEYSTARALMDEEEEGYHDSSVLGGSTEGRFLGWHESEVGGGGGGGGGSRRGSHRSSSADVQASFAESARGSGGGSGEEGEREGEGERVPRPSGFARPPPAYEALFGSEGEAKI